MTRHTPITQAVHLQGFSPEQLLEVVRGARFEHFILSRAKCDAQLTRWSLGDFTVDTGSYSFPVRAVGAFPRGRVCLGYMRAQSAPTWVNGFCLGDSSVEFYPDGSELNYRAGPDATWVAIEFDETSLQAAARERLGHEVALPWKHVVSFRVPRADRAALDGMVDRLWTHPVSGARMIRPILGAIAEMLHAQRGRAAVEAIKAWERQAIIGRADEFLRSHLASPFELESLAAATGAHARTLQRTFREACGLTPHEWARCHALHRVRERLQSPAARRFTVEAIAHDCGFRHMGRFSGYYRELFGEPPSLINGRPARWPQDGRPERAA